MTFKLKYISLLALILFSLQQCAIPTTIVTSRTLSFYVPPPSTSPLLKQISLLLRNFFPTQKVVLVYRKEFLRSIFNKNIYLAGNLQLDQLFSMPEVISESGGLTNLNYASTQTSLKRPRVSTFDVTQAVVLLLPFGIQDTTEEHLLHEHLHLPLLDPATAKNIDKFTIVTGKAHLESLYRCSLIQKIKYKIFLTLEDSPPQTFRQYCLHCPIKETTLSFSSLTTPATLYPDFQTNYYGYPLKASATDKMFAHFQYEKDPITGKFYGKRGVFNSVLNHLTVGLNFTAEIYPASGQGSTGTQLANGTWVGSVGDVYYGNATFCMLCSMGYSRHTVVEMSSPVTYEYIRFAIGPPKKVFTWQAIFWSFSKMLWLAVMVTTVLVVLCIHLFLKYDKFQEMSFHNWTAYTSARYFGGVFLEQADYLPSSLPEPIRIVIGFWLLFALVGSNAYKAKMVGFMTFPVMGRTPDTYSELVSSDYEIQFHYFPNIVYNSFKLSTSRVIHATFLKMIKEPDPIKCLRRTLTHKSVCIIWTSAQDDTVNRNLSDRFGYSPIRSSRDFAFLFTPGIVLEKMADSEENFKCILCNSLEMGLNHYWKRSDAYDLLKLRNEWINQLSENERRNAFRYEDESGDVLKLKHLKGASVILITGLIIACVFFLMEHMVRLAVIMGYFESRKQGCVIDRFVFQSNLISKISKEK